jgi:hypothetical protein
MRAALIAFATLAFALLVAAPLSPSHAIGEWRKIGTRTVNFIDDHDTINVGRSEGRFHVLRFEVEGGAIVMHNMRVVFENGGAFSPPTEYTFSDNEWSRVIDLPGRARFIDHIAFNYRSLHTGEGKATITVYGR